MKTAVIAIFLFFNVFKSVSLTNYCALCANHIACHNNGKFARTCPADARIATIGSTEINVLLNAHNNFRNRLAGGQIRGFRSARKMNKVFWDPELAWLAELNVRQCEMRHDGCRATPKFRNAGQNLYWSGTSGNYPSISTSLNQAVIGWGNEYTKASQSDIDSCCGGSNFLNIGHFLQVAQDRVIRIGCAAARYTKGQWRSTLIACNYSWGNMRGQPVYESGRTASGCRNGRDAKFKNLCA